MSVYIISANVHSADVVHYHYVPCGLDSERVLLPGPLPLTLAWLRLVPEPLPVRLRHACTLEKFPRWTPGLLPRPEGHRHRKRRFNTSTLFRLSKWWPVGVSNAELIAKESNQKMCTGQLLQNVYNRDDNRGKKTHSTSVPTVSCINRGVNP